MKIFISQPMGLLSDEEIKAEREKIRTMYEGKGEILNTYFENTKMTALECLGESIKMLKDADVAVFCKGWEYARGCRIEHQCCVDYSIPKHYINYEM